MNKIIAILIILLTQSLNGQIVFSEQLFPNVRVIETKQFGGSGGKGYWNYKYLDRNGRVILEEKYKKKELLAVYSHRYDQFNNKVSTTTVYDINYPNGEDEHRVSKFSYNYDNNGRVTEKKSSIGKSNYIKKITSQIDSNSFEIIEINQW